MYNKNAAKDRRRMIFIFCLGAFFAPGFMAGMCTQSQGWNASPRHFVIFVVTFVLVVAPWAVTIIKWYRGPRVPLVPLYGDVNEIIHLPRHVSRLPKVSARNYEGGE